MRILSEWFDNDNNNIPPHELQRKGDIECYDRFMEQCLTIQRYGGITYSYHLNKRLKNISKA
jgi:hypothetical protein